MLADENDGLISSSNESSFVNPNVFIEDTLACGTVFGYEYFTEFSRLSTESEPNKSSRCIVANESFRRFEVFTLFLN